MKNKYLIGVLCIIGVLINSCSISYSLSGTSVDYSKVSSISIKDFPNQAAQIYPPLSQVLTEALKDNYTRKTRLQQISDNGDLDIEGEITSYQLTPLAVKEDAYSSETRLTITIRVRYSNRPEPEKDFERTFSAYQDFDAGRIFDNALQDELCTAIVEELVDQIYNSTVADW